MLRRGIKTAASPGTLVYTGKEEVEEVSLTVIHYSLDHFEIISGSSLSEVEENLSGDGVVWVNVNGLHDVELIEQIGNRFEIHPLVLEDLLSVKQRPKIEDHECYIFTVLRMMYVEDSDLQHKENNPPAESQITEEQVSIIFNGNLVITFQEKSGDVFQDIRERLRGGKGRIRGAPGDYLAYALLDAIVDHYFIVNDEMNERIAELDDLITQGVSSEGLEEIYRIKRSLIHMRRHIAPVREILNVLERASSPHINNAHNLFFRDVQDHLLQSLDSLDFNREVLSELTSVYLSAVGNKTNDIMKLLTLMAALFIPITFVAGVYGMNFEYIPELQWRYGYLYFWGVVIGVTALLLGFFRRKGWL